MTRIVARLDAPPLDLPDETLVDVLRATVHDHGDKPAFLDTDGRPTATWRDVHERARRLAQGLLALGLRPGERVAIISETRPEWILADHAILLAGGTTVSAFRSFADATLVDVLTSSRARFAFVEDEDVLRRASGAPGIERWIVLAPPAPADKRAMTLDALEAEPTPALDARGDAVGPDEVAVIIYTSGTTGRPKGAMLTHRNLVSDARSSIVHLGLRPHPIGLAFLPLAHSYQRQAGVVVTILAGAVAFSAPPRLARDLPRVRPTLFPAVPRLYERLHARIEDTARRMLPHRRAIFGWASRVARERGRRILRGEAPRASFAGALAERLVFRRIRRMGGLDRLELAITGAAPMRTDLLEFFWGIGIPIVEGYGLTETTAPSTVNDPKAPRAGTVGRPMPGTRAAIADDGEVLLAGPHVFVGYDGLPDETREAFVEIDGVRWFRTGDIGVIEDGALRIVDRKKELEVLDTGKKVPPSPIEEKLKSSPLVAEAMVVADGRKFVAALLWPDLDALLRFAQENGVAFDAGKTQRGALATGEEGVVAVDPALVDDAQVRAALARHVEEVNATLAEYERIKAFRALPTALAAPSGEVTPTLKKRRKTILQTRAADVDRLFRGRETS